MRKFLTLFFVSILFLIVSCAGYSDDVVGERVVMHHSSLLEITDCSGYTVVDVRNPWGEGVLKRYLLVHHDSIMPDDMPRGTLLRVPLERVVLFSGVHAALFSEFGALSSISGVCDSRYMYSDAVRIGLEQGTVVDCGSSLNVNTETVAQVNPDAIFVLPYENGGYGKLDNMAYPLVECADYMETSPLGCAEWMRFYGRLMGRGAESDSLFNAVCSEYETLCRQVNDVKERPRLMCELKSSSAWYVPGGKSTMGQMYKDAGAEYLFADCGSNGSVPLAFEVVLDKAADADIWIVKYNSEEDKDFNSLLAGFDGYTHFRPFKERNIYACNTHKNNLFEEATFHPERLLKELAALFHPYLFPEYTPIYYEKMY